MPLNKEEKQWLHLAIESRIDHLTSSPETKKDILSLQSDMKRLDAELKNKVAYKVFFWVVGILLGIVMSLLAYMTNQIHDIQEKTYTISNSVSTIAGFLENL